MENKHIEYMKTALDKAYSAFNSEYKEVPIGCIIVNEQTNSIIAQSYNQTNEYNNASKHCELIALDSLYNLDILPYCVMYVTVEPCIMCASAILLHYSSIKAIYYGCNNDRFGGCKSVYNVLQFHNNDSKIEVVSGLLESESILLLKKFYDQVNDKAPIPKVKKIKLN